MNSIEIQKVTKKFDGAKALDNLSVSIRKGEISGIIGPNGSGKTTLINILSGMLKKDTGTVMIGKTKKSKNIRPWQAQQYGITRTFQDSRIFEQMTVMDNLLVVLTKRNVFAALTERHKENHHKRAEDIIKKIHLWKKRNHLAGDLSYGQRKLLEIGRALAVEAEVYLLDEPFAGLFPEMITTVSKIVKELKQNGKSVILIEHNMDLIREMCDRVIVMESGSLLAEGKTEEVLKKREVIKAYIGQ